MVSSQGTRKDSSQGTRKVSSQSNRKDFAAALDRVAIVLIGIYLVQFIAAVIPPNINDPRWAIGILDSLRGVGFLPLIGGALILLAKHMDRQSAIISRHRRWLQKVAPLAALGFFLIIPLQGLVSYNVITAARSESTQKISKLNRAMAMIRSAQDETALRSGISEIGFQSIPPGNLNAPNATFKEQLVSQLASEISRLQFRSDKEHNKILQGMILQWLRDASVAILYGFGFRGLSKRADADANTSGGRYPKFISRRW